MIVTVLHNVVTLDRAKIHPDLSTVLVMKVSLVMVSSVLTIMNAPTLLLQISLVVLMISNTILTCTMVMQPVTIFKTTLTAHVLTDTMVMASKVTA